MGITNRLPESAINWAHGAREGLYNATNRYRVGASLAAIVGSQVLLVRSEARNDSDTVDKDAVWELPGGGLRPAVQARVFLSSRYLETIEDSEFEETAKKEFTEETDIPIDHVRGIRLACQSVWSEGAGIDTNRVYVGELEIVGTDPYSPSSTEIQKVRVYDIQEAHEELRLHHATQAFLDQHVAAP